MLQQTRVDTVVPYYLRWVEKYKSIKSVAKADGLKLLKLWEGLGYYSRCRNFHKACKIIVNDYSGEIPSDYQKFRLLPGVGDYTASAVFSIGLKQTYAATDGNVRRVMARVLRIKNITNHNKKRINNTLIKWMDRERPGDINQALMDLANKICRVDHAQCSTCPIDEICMANKMSIPESYPARVKKKIIPHKEIVAGIIWQRDKFLITKRTENGLLGGLWELPGGEIVSSKTPIEALRRQIKEEWNIDINIKKKVGCVKHAYSHFKITLTLYQCQTQESVKNMNKEYRWITPAEIKYFPFPKSNHKLFNVLNSDDWNV
jgi:A/G-specific adenine glycosylase